jgi:ComF family protein
VRKSILPAPASRSQRFLSALLHCVLPQVCYLCGGASGNAPLCAACIRELPQPDPQCCPRCALPTVLGKTCGACLRHQPNFDRVLTAFIYDFPVDRLIQGLKYGGELALADWLGARLLALANTCPADLVVPLPLHPLRLRERGFNQALELARPLARAGFTINAAICSRTRATPAQAGLALRRRIANLRGAFACHGDLGGQHVLLVDDVMTSGATLNECARTLKLHGAATVTALVVARTLPGRHGHANV